MDKASPSEDDRFAEEMLYQEGVSRYAYHT